MHWQSDPSKIEGEMSCVLLWQGLQTSFILSYFLSERYRTVYRQFGYANKHPNWMCQKHVKKNSKTKMQKVLVLARSLTCHHSEFQNARSHSHCTAQQSFSKCTHVHSSERNNYFTVHRRYL